MNTNVTAPIYYILGGIDNGIVIEKNIVGYRLFTELSSSDDWFYV